VQHSPVICYEPDIQRGHFRLSLSGKSLVPKRSVGVMEYWVFQRSITPILQSALRSAAIEDSSSGAAIFY
jgi:hypothetical protein